MLRFHPSRFSWILMSTLGLWTVAAQAQEFRYRYVSLDFDQIELPSGFIFFQPTAINNSGRVYGDAYDDEFFLPHVAVYAGGVVTVLQPGQPGSIVRAVNQGGTIGGSILIDEVNFTGQAALFHGDRVEPIPPQPGESNSFVLALNDSGMALVLSENDSGPSTFVLYKNGQSTPLDLGSNIANPDFLHINNQGIISGTNFIPGVGFRGFRFDPRTGKTTQLDPLPTEPDAWALDINNRGDVLGYSFVPGGRERVGVWNRHGWFQTYFVEGIPGFPTVSNDLLFNDNNLIVITRVSKPKEPEEPTDPPSEVGNSYLIPRPGVRLNLADLVENLPPVEAPVQSIIDVNNHGSMIGYRFIFPADFTLFLLERIGVGSH